MQIGILSVDINILDSHSLKAKRQILRSIKERIKNKFNVSLAETDYHDKWQRSRLVMANVAQDRRYVDSQLMEVINFLRKQLTIVVVDYNVEIL